MRRLHHQTDRHAAASDRDREVPRLMSARPAILLVEDNPITRKLVRFALQQEHFDLSEASDAATALELAEKKRPDLILQDLLLPDMDGFALVARFRAMPALGSVPIFAFSGL